MHFTVRLAEKDTVNLNVILRPFITLKLKAIVIKHLRAQESTLKYKTTHHSRHFYFKSISLCIICITASHKYRLQNL